MPWLCRVLSGRRALSLCVSGNCVFLVGPKGGGTLARRCSQAKQANGDFVPHHESQSHICLPHTTELRSWGMGSVRWGPLSGFEGAAQSQRMKGREAGGPGSKVYLRGLLPPPDHTQLFC